MISICDNFLTNLGPKHAKFGPILHNFRLWSWISPEWDKTSKMGKIYDLERFLPRSAKQVRWTLVHFTIHKVVHVSLDQPKSTFSTDYISAPRGCWVLKFLHVLEFDQALVAHIAIGVGGPLKNFKSQHLKLGLKFHTWAPLTLGIVGLPSRNFTRWRGSSRGDQVDTNFTRGAHYKIWESKKRSKFSAIFDNLRLWSQMSPERINISKIGKVLDQLHFIPY